MSDRGDDPGPARRYVLGHSDRELNRLSTQARLIDPITRRFFHDAGIAPGMRVLDVGSGAGDVAFLAADMVGGTGQVVGVDRVPAALAVAQARAESRSLRHVSFREGDPAEMQFESPFDAAVGRYVLQFQPDPAAMLRRLATRVRPGGLIVFHELDWDGVRSFPPSPIHDECCRWISETIRSSGAETRMGIKLHSTFVAAGLAEPSMRLEAVIGGGAMSSDLVRLTADLAATLLPEAERLGLATGADVALETLAERMTSQVIARGVVLVGRLEVGAWSRLPGS